VAVAGLPNCSDCFDSSPAFSLVGFAKPSSCLLADKIGHSYHLQGQFIMPAKAIIFNENSAFNSFQIMQLNTANAEEYLRSRSILAPSERVRIRELGGGVSNAVYHIAGTNGDDFVLKQARDRLNVADPWFCGVERIWREIDVLRICERVILTSPLDSPLSVEVPHLLFEDRANYLYAMSAAPADHVVWKSELLAGVSRDDIARSCGTLLGALHARTWHDKAIADQLDDRQFFEELRIDPYYRQVARVHSDLAPAIDGLIDSVWGERHCLVHGDFSPKNILICGDRLMLIDFEVGHYGDPAFDLGFFLSHLVLKAAYHAPCDEPYLDIVGAFWLGYRAEIAKVVGPTDLDALVRRGILNLAGCALARLDGKSRIEYLDDAGRREAIRKLARTIFAEQPHDWSDVRRLCEQLIRNL
jgi:tRNA A-37 threonylcarbamoyl transferase component Bud32